ncbi:DUF418 domain-containing protein [Schaalia suimastitidis]|uniref:DUF418 domain-containing protein n=1 Tax=Schaalia suimastitidis TaxID=121163 RepID=UPI000418B7E9|nr:DUF418 domain-containing protein [Schaalia suimastitidis]
MEQLSVTPPPSLSIPAPARYAGRLIGLDLARALAVIGMIWAHTVHIYPSTAWGIFLEAIPHGRSALLFTFLAGVSISIITGRNIAYTGMHMQVAKLRLVGRALGLFFIGGLLYTFAHPVAVILGFYALWFLVAIPQVHLSAKTLFISGTVLALVGPQVVWVFSSFSLFANIFGGTGLHAVFSEGFVTGMYPGLAYFAVILIGMGVGRLDLAKTPVKLWMIGVGLVTATMSYGFSWIAGHSFAAIPFDSSIGLGSSSIGSGSISPSTPTLSGDTSSWIMSPEAIADEKSYLKQRLADLDAIARNGGKINPEEYFGSSMADPLLEGDPSAWTYTWQTLFGSSAHSNTTFEILGAIGVSLALVGMLLLVQHYVRIALKPVAALGSMSLTAYVAHIVAIGFAGDLLYIGPSTRGFVIIVVALLIFAFVWTFFFARGPLEWLLSRFADAVARSGLGGDGSGATAPHTAPHVVQQPASHVVQQPAPHEGQQPAPHEGQQPAPLSVPTRSATPTPTAPPTQSTQHTPPPAPTIGNDGNDA